MADPASHVGRSQATLGVEVRPEGPKPDAQKANRLVGILGEGEASLLPSRAVGVVVSGIRRMNEVNARRAQLVPGWVTVFGRVYHPGM